jgi:hypothetical protein
MREAKGSETPGFKGKYLQGSQVERMSSLGKRNLTE